MRRLKRLLWMAATLLLAAGAGTSAGQDGAGFSFGSAGGKNDACLACHADPAKVKGAGLIDPARFAHTTHARIGCAACHDALSRTHPDRTGSPRADCRGCHTDIGREYGASMHAGKTGCAGCHDPHRAATPREISGREINQMCSRCHEGYQMTARHGAWLPQADLHLRMLPCITCHTGSQGYFISMYIVKGKNGSRFGRQEVASYEELKRLAGGGEILSLIDVNGDRYVSIEELRRFNRDPFHRYLRLQGMMTPETASHRFEILDSRRNCTFCHASGPSPMQKSVLALPAKDGTFGRVAVEQGAVFDVLYGTPDFYLMGSTKSATMNGIGAAIIAGGLVMPVGHGFLRFLTRKNRKGKEHES